MTEFKHAIDRLAEIVENTLDDIADASSTEANIRLEIVRIAQEIHPEDEDKLISAAEKIARFVFTNRSVYEAFSEDSEALLGELKHASEALKHKAPHESPEEEKIAA
jgi:hypothetical protein